MRAYLFLFLFLLLPLTGIKAEVIITGDGSTDVDTAPGRTYSVLATGDFGGGTITASFVLGEEAVPIDFSANEAGVYTLFSPTNKIRFTTSGSNDPSVKLNLAPTNRSTGGSGGGGGGATIIGGDPELFIKSINSEPDYGELFLIGEDSQARLAYYAGYGNEDYSSVNMSGETVLEIGTGLLIPFKGERSNWVLVDNDGNWVMVAFYNDDSNRWEIVDGDENLLYYDPAGAGWSHPWGVNSWVDADGNPTSLDLNKAPDWQNPRSYKAITPLTLPDNVSEDAEFVMTYNGWIASTGSGASGYGEYGEVEGGDIVFRVRGVTTMQVSVYEGGTYNVLAQNLPNNSRFSFYITVETEDTVSLNLAGFTLSTDPAPPNFNVDAQRIVEISGRVLNGNKLAQVTVYPR